MCVFVRACVVRAWVGGCVRACVGGWVCVRACVRAWVGVHIQYLNIYLVWYHFNKVIFFFFLTFFIKKKQRTTTGLMYAFLCLQNFATCSHPALFGLLWSINVVQYQSVIQLNGFGAVSATICSTWAAFQEIKKKKHYGQIQVANPAECVNEC